jgi:hypothetical protein
VREDAVLQPGEEDDRELQALGGVQRHQGDHTLVVRIVGGDLVGVGDQRDLLQEAGDRGPLPLLAERLDPFGVLRATLTSSGGCPPPASQVRLSRLIRWPGRSTAPQLFRGAVY